MPKKLAIIAPEKPNPSVTEVPETNEGRPDARYAIVSASKMPATESLSVAPALVTRHACGVSVLVGKQQAASSG